MPFCEDCGAEFLDGAFCTNCGAAQNNLPVSHQTIRGARLPSTTPSNAQLDHTESNRASKPFLNQFQRNVVFVAITVLLLVVAGIFVNGAMQARAKRIEEQKIQWKKANIKILKDLSGIGALSTEEQTRVDNAGDDLDRLQQVLLDIHQERITFWRGQLDELQDAATKYQNLRAQYGGLQDGYYSPAVNDPSVIEAGSELQKKLATARDNLAGYEYSWANIRRWKPVSFENFRAGKMIDPGPTGQANPSEQ